MIITIMAKEGTLRESTVVYRSNQLTVYASAERKWMERILVYEKNFNF